MTKDPLSTNATSGNVIPFKPRLKPPLPEYLFFTAAIDTHTPLEEGNVAACSC
jgi:hypothetical protein